MPDGTQRKSTFFQTTALCLLISFTLSTVSPQGDLAHAQSIPAALAETHVNPGELLDSLTLPGALGTIQERFSGEDQAGEKPLILYLQSAHTNLDSETNTRKIIGYFEKEYGLNLILLEGGEGRLDSLFFKSFPDEDLKKNVLNDYLSKGDLSGAEVSSILDENHDTHYYGIEDQALYQANKDAFLKALENGPALLKLLTREEEKLQEDINRLSSPALLTFIQNSQALNWLK